MSEKVKDLVLREMLSDADSYGVHGPNLPEYVRGLINGVAIAQGRTWSMVAWDLLDAANREGVYEDAVDAIKEILTGD